MDTEASAKADKTGDDDLHAKAEVPMTGCESRRRALLRGVILFDPSKGSPPIPRVVRAIATLGAVAALLGMGARPVSQAIAADVVDLGVVLVGPEERDCGGEWAEMRRSLARCWVDRRECRAVIRSSTVEGVAVEVAYRIVPRAATRSAMVVTTRREGREWPLPEAPIRVGEESFECDEPTLLDVTALSGENVQKAAFGLRRRMRDTGRWLESQRRRARDVARAQRRHRSPMER